MAVHHDTAAVLFDDFVNDEQTEPRALADFLGGEKGVEDPRQHFRRDAMTAVMDLDIHHLSTVLAFAEGLIMLVGLPKSLCLKHAV